ncbi:trimethylamine---corrinoid protein Co-methyltransferase [Candidatus Hakubella thermalkaliphila]|uniref:Trimethylamine---corrinoid protein Co-methyltransferase n=1 Tax=Candidatus Hakubella thermalkaliphila TaxID=2754717 RepID=A0A6V8P5U1_9ACTN|nr:trimethylamine methyltransferase family protein [Candidatus Hakubella thermalkaliphila]GFP27999.1 trimethylamine---corrinoid protein Co-methyltransferase [Candidatus Hakubella thermalkaliphila]GFP34461.1 trimethylamine---corrinoid protein Co-methyltransferase [Candidatus Hakubella thermalkaliphila]
MRINYQVNQTVFFKVLSEDQIEEIYLGALEVLERTGVKIYQERAVKLLKEAGCDVTEGNRVRIPTSLVQQALATAPSRIGIANRRGERVMMLEDGKVYYGPGPTCPNILDPYTKERRKFLKNDARNTARLCDALPNIDFVMSLGSISDVPQALADLHEFEAMVTNSIKPIVAWAFYVESMKDIYEMCVAIAGSEEEFLRNPFMIFYAEPNTPLYHGKDAVEKLLFAAEKKIPIVYTPCPMAGGTAPATMAGMLVDTLAECLSGVVMSQVVRPGAPIIMGGVVSIMDMATTILSYGAPELALASAALAEVARWLKLPMWSTGGCTDSKLLDEQAALEAALNLLLAGLSGANLIHDVGFMESAMTGSQELLVLSDEIIGMVKRVVRGVEVNEETLALDIIHKVGPGGNFLGEDHTLRHFRTEAWYPRLLDRRMYLDWVGGGSLTLAQRVNKKTREVLESYQPVPLPQDVLEGIDEILRRADERAAEIEAQKV